VYIDLRETASPPEVLWTLIGVVALAINLWLLRDVWLDARALNRLGQNGAKKIAVMTAIGIQVGLTLPQVIAVAIGIVSLLVPPSSPHAIVTAPLVIVTVGILLIEIILTLVALFTRVRRTRLLDYMESSESDTIAMRHAETMGELVHITEVTTEARDGAQYAANSLNEMIMSVQEDIAATNKVAATAAAAAMENTDRLRELVERLERERSTRDAGDHSAEDRADARSEREQDRQDTRDDRRAERERNRP